MVPVSYESQEDVETRLRKVMAEASFQVYEGAYAFEEFPLADFAARASTDALALVRDSELWSQLVPSKDSSKELFCIFSFHFDSCSEFLTHLCAYL